MKNEKVKFLLNWNHFADHLSGCMTKLMTDVSYSDVIIATADKHMIYSHRFVLAYSSKYFQRLLKNVKMQREIQLVVALPEIKYEVFKILMNYMYKGETQVPHELLPSVIKAGQFLEIYGLVNMSESEGGTSGGGGGSHDTLPKNVPTERCSVSGGNGGNSAEPKKTVSTIQYSGKILTRESSASKETFRGEMRGRGEKGQVQVEPQVIVAPADNAKENQRKMPPSKNVKSKSENNSDYIRLPVKRKTFIREPVKKSTSVSSPSSSSSPAGGTDRIDSCPPKKNFKRLATMCDVFPIKIKTEKGIIESPPPENTKTDEVENMEERITIKVEEPDEIEEVEYNELRCEFCHEVYTNPSEWVKHMTENHGDRGFQTFKESDRIGGNTSVITCVVCSLVCYSASDWANHLKLWHTDRDMAEANMSDTKQKTSSKVKKKSGPFKKQ